MRSHAATAKAVRTQIVGGRLSRSSPTMTTWPATAEQLVRWGLSSHEV